MVNNRKVRLMTRLAIFEKKEGQEDIKLGNFFRTDYVRLKVLKTVVSITIGYLLLLLLLVVYKSEFLLQNAVTLDYRRIVIKYALYYVLIATVYIAVTMIVYMVKYSTSRRKLAKYFRMLRKLRSLYREENGELTEEYTEQETEQNDRIDS